VGRVNGPTPLRPTTSLDPFPVDLLPAPIAAMVNATAEFTQTPPDLAGTVALGVMSACAGGRAVVEIRRGWREPVNLYTVCAMAPGSRKSAVFATLTAPLLDVEQELTDDTAAAIVEAETLKKVALKRAERMAQAAAADDDASAAADAVDAALAAEAITVPKMPRIAADNVTPEAAATLLAEQGGRLAVLSAEGGIFDLLAGRYSNGIPDIDVWLKGHAGDTLRIDRRGRPPEFVPRPALTVCLTVQPSVLRTIGKNATFAGRGLLARFLYALPDNTVGRRRVGTAPVNESIADAYISTIKSLAHAMSEWTDPAVLTLTPEAHDVVLDAERALEPRLGPHGNLGHIADWGSKLVGATVRIAALIHLAANPSRGWASPITEEEMRSAVRIGEFFGSHAVAVFAHMGADPIVEAAELVVECLRRRQWEQFSERDLFRALPRSQFGKVGDLRDVLEVLEAHGYIYRAPAPDPGTPGRPPSPEYVVVPEVLTELTELTQTQGSVGSVSSVSMSGPS
jgi:hypothetical protein